MCCIALCRENRTKYDASWEDEHGGSTSEDILKYSMMVNYSWDEALSRAQDPKQTFVTTINVPLVVRIVIIVSV